MSVLSVQNKVAIITGCSSGIGLATARLFLERQAKVFGIDIGSLPQNLASTYSTNFTFHQADLTQPSAVDEAVSRCTQQHGRIDILVNCAGIVDGWSSADTFHEDEWERVMAINLTVPLKLMKAVLPAMKERKGGAIVNVASKAGMSGASAGIAYTASKHGLVSVFPFAYGWEWEWAWGEGEMLMMERQVGATKNVAWRFHNDGIRCNAVLPGGVATNIMSSVQMDHFDSGGFNAFL